MTHPNDLDTYPVEPETQATLTCSAVLIVDVGHHSVAEWLVSGGCEDDRG